MKKNASALKMTVFVFEIGKKLFSCSGIRTVDPEMASCTVAGNGTDTEKIAAIW